MNKFFLLKHDVVSLSAMSYRVFGVFVFGGSITDQKNRSPMRIVSNSVTIKLYTLYFKNLRTGFKRFICNSILPMTCWLSVFDVISWRKTSFMILCHCSDSIIAIHRNRRIDNKTCLPSQPRGPLTLCNKRKRVVTRYVQRLHHLDWCSTSLN